MRNSHKNAIHVYLTRRVWAKISRSVHEDDEKCNMEREREREREREKHASSKWVL